MLELSKGGVRFVRVAMVSPVCITTASNGIEVFEMDHMILVDFELPELIRLIRGVPPW